MMPDVVPQDALIPMPHGIIDRRRGTWAMLLFIVTEASLFVMLFFTYYYFGSGWRGTWPPERPKMMLALIMLAMLLSSSVVLHAGELAERRGRKALARALVLATIVIGAAFMGVQALEYRDHLKTLTPQTNAYGSIFYTITSFHAAHVILGLLMLCYVLILPEMGPAEKPPHHALHNASLYWHFVDAVWIVIVTLLYVMPNVGR